MSHHQQRTLRTDAISKRNQGRQGQCDQPFPMHGVHCPVQRESYRKSSISCKGTSRSVYFQGMSQAIRDFAKNESHGDSAILVILSHGEENVIIGIQLWTEYERNNWFQVSTMFVSIFRSSMTSWMPTTHLVWLTNPSLYLYKLAAESAETPESRFWIPWTESPVCWDVVSTITTDHCSISLDA